MSKRSAKNRVYDTENLCSYCLFFQPVPSGRKLQGNCTYHKEWIENASRTTCSDMANEPLQEKGIYRVLGNNGDGWSYVRRPYKMRTRLFLIKGSKVKNV